jgi:hypothetical protein
MQISSIDPRAFSLLILVISTKIRTKTKRLEILNEAAEIGFFVFDVQPRPSKPSLKWRADQAALLEM